MNETRLSLLRRVQDGSEEAWQDLAKLYSPLVNRWFERHGIAHHDAEELTQDVMAILVRKVPEFVHSGHQGAFRSWLRVITANRTKEFWRSNDCRPKTTGGSTFLDIVQQLADDNSELARTWDAEHDQYLLRGLFQLITGQFEETTLAAFRRLVLDGASPEAVAKELDLSIGAVYSAKSRVLRRLRLEAAGIVDESFFS